MAAYSMLVGLKGTGKDAEKTVLACGHPQEINARFKELVLEGSDEFNSLEVVTSREGRTKRKNLVSTAEAKKRAAEAEEARKAREAVEASRAPEEPEEAEATEEPEEAEAPEEPEEAEAPEEPEEAATKKAAKKKAAPSKD